MAFVEMDFASSGGGGVIREIELGNDAYMYGVVTDSKTHANLFLPLNLGNATTCEIEVLRMSMRGETGNNDMLLNSTDVTNVTNVTNVSPIGVKIQVTPTWYKAPAYNNIACVAQIYEFKAKFS